MVEEEQIPQWIRSLVESHDLDPLGLITLVELAAGQSRGEQLPGDLVDEARDLFDTLSGVGADVPGLVADLRVALDGGLADVGPRKRGPKTSQEVAARNHQWVIRYINMPPDTTKDDAASTIYADLEAEQGASAPSWDTIRNALDNWQQMPNRKRVPRGPGRN